MFLKIKKITGLAAGIVFVAALFVYANLQNRFLGYPHVPSPQTGQTAPHLVKGVTVFISEGDQQLLTWSTYVGIASAAIVALVLLIHRGDPFRSKDR
jgi:hypothetical protein